jgi:hypothetical protein
VNRQPAISRANKRGKDSRRNESEKKKIMKKNNHSNAFFECKFLSQGVMFVFGCMIVPTIQYS